MHHIEVVRETNGERAAQPGENKDGEAGGIASRASTNEAAVVKATFLTRRMALPLGEGVPEPERLVTSPGHYRFALRAHSQIEYSMRMTCKGSDHVE